MNKLKLSIACDMYDHIQPLIDGSVSPKDIDLNIVTVVGGDRHDRMIKGEFDSVHDKLKEIKEKLSGIVYRFEYNELMRRVEDIELKLGIKS